MPSNFAFLPTGPSRLRPTGNPVAVKPAGNVMPGAPDVLPGSEFRIMVAKVSTSGPPLTEIFEDPFWESMTGRYQADRGRSRRVAN